VQEHGVPCVCTGEANAEPAAVPSPPAKPKARRNGRRRAEPARKVMLRRKASNRIAQARSREKRKKLAEELQARVPALIAELDAMRMVPEQARALNADNQRLRAIAWRREHLAVGKVRRYILRVA
jgi:bZIP transcription factor